jgi:hypothetical protein
MAGGFMTPGKGEIGIMFSRYIFPLRDNLEEQRTSIFHSRLALMG